MTTQLEINAISDLATLYATLVKSNNMTLDNVKKTLGDIVDKVSDKIQEGTFLQTKNNLEAQGTNLNDTEQLRLKKIVFETHTVRMKDNQRQLFTIFIEAFAKQGIDATCLLPEYEK